MRTLKEKHLEEINLKKKDQKIENSKLIMNILKVLFGQLLLLNLKIPILFHAQLCGRRYIRMSRALRIASLILKGE